jgi:hypothetical protein
MGKKGNGGPKISSDCPRKSLDFEVGVGDRLGTLRVSKSKGLLSMAKILELLKDWKSVMFGVWPAPGSPETLQKGGGGRPPPFAWVSGAPGAAQAPKITDFQSFKKSRFV